MRVLYGIKTCDNVKKARKWLDDHQLEYRFHDFRVDGLDATLIHRFTDILGLEAVLNKQSTSWRQLDKIKTSDLTEAKAIQLLLETPTLIKRPILDDGLTLIVGFHPEQYVRTNKPDLNAISRPDTA